MEMRNLLEFGALPFTHNALACAFHISDRSSASDDEKQIEPLDSTLLGPTGIADDAAANVEWLWQLEKLSSDLPARFDSAEINTAMRHLVRQVPTEPRWIGNAE